MRLACAFVVALILASSSSPLAAGEVYRPRTGQVLGCENAETLATIAELRQKQTAEPARIRMLSEHGRCVSLTADLSLAVEARQPSPAGTVALVRTLGQGGDYAGGRWWVMLNDVELSGYTR